MDSNVACVFTFGVTDYECVGVFTNPDEAKAFAEAKEAENPGKRFPVVGRTFNALIDEVIKTRLGRMADILFAKEQEALDARHKQVPDEEHGIRVPYIPINVSWRGGR